MLTLLTPTGDRPEAWELCKRWMRQQDYAGDVRWVIVDDGREPQSMEGLPSGWSIHVVRPDPCWEMGQNTQARNLTAGLEAIPADAQVAIIEDDDYYGPSYLTTIFAWLATADLVGERGALYFNLQTLAAMRCPNTEHASLCQTACKGAALSALRDTIAKQTGFIDMTLWREFTGSKLLSDTTHAIGIKGLPGRGGIGVGHQLQQGSIPLCDVQALLGDNWSAYAPYMNQ